ncbi:MAG TPA: GNAT family N-acetyltransferase [Pedococcus sp.]|nr:GNAT family N-acetyltransferase [Pedococcus sp.]
MTQAAALPPGYPAWWEADVVLRDGSVAHLRPITPADASAVHRFHAGQSDESIYMRFFAPLRQLSERDVTRFTTVDYHDRVALVATVRGEIIGIGRYDRITPTSAEVAFNISDHFQGKGIGSVLLEHLAVIAWDSGIEEFTAEVLPQNRKMMSVFGDAGYEVSRRFEDGVVSLRFDIQPTERSEAVRLSREHRAESVSMHSVLFPDSIAVVGASRRTDSIGHHILANILAAGFHGAVHAVNREAMEVLGLPSHARVSEIPDDVDLAVVAVPADEVLEVVADCAEAGVRTLLVVSAGFAEAGPAGEELQAELLTRARAAGMRVLGPNSFGVINNSPHVRLNASLAPELPPAGRLGLFAQSGALGIAVLASAARRGLGISVFASAGNRVDVSGNDFMQYWIDDQDTDVVGLYLESMGNPRKFSRIARRLALTKPVVVVKSGVSSYGVPPGHRARTTRVRPEAFDAMLRQAGVIRVENVHQMFDVAQLLVHQPLPGGNRVAVVGNSDALGALTAEACVSWGLEVTHGPVSLPSDARGELFAQALADAFADPDVDSVLTCFIPPLVTLDEDVATAVRDAALLSDKPCLATFLGMRGVVERLAGTTSEGREEVVPAYSMPEDAVRALAAATRYAAWRSRDHGVPVRPVGIDREAAQHLVDEVLERDPEGRRLTPTEAGQLLQAYGIEMWQSIPVTTADEAVAAAEVVGYPVVVKSVAPLMQHSPGLSGIRVDLRTEGQLRGAFEALNELLTPLSANAFVVQRMAAQPGISCVVRSEEDPLFGPVVSFSIAGAPTELLGDIGHRIPPLTDVDVSDLISSVKASPMLHGHRGAAPVHRAALADLIARVSVLADNLPEVASLVLNPVNAHAGGVEVLGAEVTLSPMPRRKDPGRRTLT